MNRVNSPYFPNSIKEVIYQTGQWCGVRSPLFRQEIDEECLEVAKLVINGETNVTNGSLYFLNKQTASRSSRNWFERELEYVARIGNHWFYR